jgi:hypothetical protein
VEQKGGLKELQLTHNVFKNMHHLTRPVIMITITIQNNIVHLSPSELQNWLFVCGWSMYCFSEIGNKRLLPSFRQLKSLESAGWGSQLNFIQAETKQNSYHMAESCWIDECWINSLDGQKLLAWPEKGIDEPDWCFSFLCGVFRVHSQDLKNFLGLLIYLVDVFDKENV